MCITVLYVTVPVGGWMLMVPTPVPVPFPLKWNVAYSDSS